MKKLLTLIAFICFFANANAQYVNIPDANFRNFLKNKFPTCFNVNNKMDTSCTAIITEDTIICTSTQISDITGIQYFKGLKVLACGYNYLTFLPKLPITLEYLACQRNYLISLPTLPTNLSVLWIFGQDFSAFNFPTFPISLKYLDCSECLLSNMPLLPDSLEILVCSLNKIKHLNKLPSTLKNFMADYNPLIKIPELPNKLERLSCVDCDSLNYLPTIPNSLTFLDIQYCDNIYCLPSLHWLEIKTYGSKIQCYPTIVNGSPSLPICSPVTNVYNCESTPVIQSFCYFDYNSNGKLDSLENVSKNIKLRISNTQNAFTNSNGVAQISTQTLGSFTNKPMDINSFYKSFPTSINHTFIKNDTIVYDTFALQPLVSKDSFAIKITPIIRTARPGFSYAYNVNVENMGTSILNPTVTVVVDTSKYIFDSTNNAVINFSGSTLSYGVNNFVPGQNNNFYVYGRVKPTAVLGSSLQAIASIVGGNATAVDTANTTVRGSFDPNDKQATPKLSVAEVVDNNHWINYTVRFQNTGNDTAFTVVVADTLDASKLQINTLQLTGLSHNCKVSQNDNIVYFEFLNINLPDSNRDKIKSNGFVSFRVKPLTTLTDGNIVPNKASIYFDYNTPINTNTANTIIGNTLPLSLTAFGAIPKEEQNKIFVYFNTANEINTNYFIIEQSLDGKEFKAIAEVAAIGKGNNSYYYNIAKNNVQFIRLKMVDKNGTYSYSNIIRITRNEKQETITVASPAKNELKINVLSTNLHNSKANLINGQGKVVKIFTLRQGYQTIDIAALQSGLYYLQTNEVVKKVVVE